MTITKDTIIGDILTIAPQTAPLFLSIGMHCLGCPASRGETVEQACMVHGVNADELLAQAHIISVHAPAADGQPIIRAETLAQMKDGVVIVNTSRGSNVDEDALLEALNSGKVWAAGLDVYRQEPSPNHDLYTHPRVSATPHIGAQTVDAQARVGQELVDILCSFFAEE